MDKKIKDVKKAMDKKMLGLLKEDHKLDKKHEKCEEKVKKMKKKK